SFPTRRSSDLPIELDELVVGGPHDEPNRKAGRTLTELLEVVDALAIDRACDDQGRAHALVRQDPHRVDGELDVLLPHDPAGDEELHLTPTPTRGDPRGVDAGLENFDI